MEKNKEFFRNMSLNIYFIYAIVEVVCITYHSKQLYMSRDAKIPVFGVSEQVRNKLACTVTEVGEKLEIRDLGRR